MDPQRARSAFGEPRAASSADEGGALLASSLASLSLAEPLPFTPAAERRGHAAARAALTPVTPFSDGDDVATPSPGPSQQLSPASVNASTPISTPPASPAVSPQVAAAAAAFGDRVAALRGELTSHALLLRCPAPGCGVPLDVPDMRQCLALSCQMCESRFCGWCLRVCSEGDVYAHLNACGGTHGTLADFKAWHRPRRAALAAQFVEVRTSYAAHVRRSSSPAFDPSLRMALLAATAPDLAAYGIALYEANGGVSYSLLDVQADEAGPATSARGGFGGFDVRPDDGDVAGDESMDDGGGARLGACAAAVAVEEAAASPATAWQRLAGPRAPLATLRDADINALRGQMQAPRVAMNAVVVMPVQRPPRADVIVETDPAAPATPEGPDARAAYAAAAARRLQPPQQRSPLSMMR